MVKLIFLDFDGVITTGKSKWNIDPKKCELIKNLCDETGAEIVLSTSWRRSTIEETLEKEKLSDWILKDYCIGVTKRLYFPIESETKLFVPRRGMEIEKYILDHYADEKINYVIFDDDVFDLLYMQRDHIVQTHWNYGVNKNNIKKAIKILNKENG